MLTSIISSTEYFSLYLVSRQGTVVDAAVRIPAVAAIPGLIVSPQPIVLSADGIANLPDSVLLLDETIAEVVGKSSGTDNLTYSSPFDTASGKPLPGRIIQVTLPLDVQAQIPANPAVSRVLVTCPKGFGHVITLDAPLALQVQLEGFVTADEGYVALTDDDTSFAVILSQNTSMSAGRYGVTFPVLVADISPPVNLWSLSFCEDELGKTPL
ncbi:hypothetical protein Pmar_PMAR025348 [Perkinsus marinus ATCC 50983]|uniref:Uncharacterized protein n=1 Tax=Perkinsus marinus (strain ATCC 50983 / TXsc) TaxID=423536 RepID=C5KS24_PERM5|nr:hypothetical protein Pmar_PMAR025348 [Perkinsus marinus ATCC 50983]EER12715.1 hypothetical protein Pmar_PMAR025348 [Perkinsus marinus ATCC 50983]|eukprot:XP_002780920.1 hypothetical protein Pmar_PMAR025348 [Perkinsus marinus ATCC 50983]